MRLVAEKMLTSPFKGRLPEPGDVVVIDPERDMRVMLSPRAEDPRVVGVMSTDPFIIANPLLKDGAAIGVMGVVRCKVEARNHPIQRGDMLCTSDIPGYGMKSISLKNGTIFGKALQNLQEGLGEIYVAANMSI